MKSTAKNVSEYLARLPKDRREALTTLRSMVTAALPEAEENMNHGVPTFSMHSPLVAFSSQKNYMSLYVNPALVEKHKAALAGLDFGKACIRFRRLDQLPLATIEKILREAATVTL